MIFLLYEKCDLKIYLFLNLYFYFLIKKTNIIFLNIINILKIFYIFNILFFF